MNSADGSIRILMYSPKSEYYTVVKKTTKVEELMESVKKCWGQEPLTLHHRADCMEIKRELAEYNVRDGSAIRVTYYAEAPH